MDPHWPPNFQQSERFQMTVNNVRYLCSAYEKNTIAKYIPQLVTLLCRYGIYFAVTEFPLRIGI
jgi:hypothetical protein